MALSEAGAVPERSDGAGKPELWEACVHCGFCLPACPTYQETGLEELSPRGRVYLVRAAAEGRLSRRDAAWLEPVDTCLDCRACEVVCPSGVRVGALIEQARSQVWAGRRASFWRRLAFRHLVPHPRRWARLARLARLYQRSGLRRLLQRLRFLGLLPDHLRQLESVLPEVRGWTVRERIRRLAPPAGVRARGRVALFTGCIQDVAFTGVNEAAARVLARNGYEVVIPREQVCCGALHRDEGDRETAVRLARRNVEVFLGALEAGVDWVVTTAGGCGAALLEYPELVGEEPAWAGRARRLAERVIDVSQLLDRQGWEPPRAAPGGARGAGPVPLRVTVQESCHLRNVMGVREAPRRLLRAVPGVELLEMPDAGRCCGSAGVYNIGHPDLSFRLMDRKAADLPEGAEVVATGNPGCALQMALGARRAGRPVRVVHPVVLLDEAYRAEEVTGDGRSG
ncbi:MAG: (Fe-S)-binding protein [Bacillota bacterium]|nr:(Fe-S)-binding protein [Bacillota bacterium]